MKRNSIWRKRLAALGLGLLGTFGGPQIAQSQTSQPTLFAGGSSYNPQPTAKANSLSSLNGLETQVQLDWLADSVTFPLNLRLVRDDKGLNVVGFVPNEMARRRALDIANKGMGGSVRDSLKVVSGMTLGLGERVPPEELRELVLQTIRARVPDSSSQINVQADDQGRVTLTGKVSSVQEQLELCKCLRQVRQCTGLTNQLMVVAVQRVPAPSPVVSKRTENLAPPTQPVPAEKVAWQGPISLATHQTPTQPPALLNKVSTTPEPKTLPALPATPEPKTLPALPATPEPKTLPSLPAIPEPKTLPALPNPTPVETPVPIPSPSSPPAVLPPLPLANNLELGQPYESVALVSWTPGSSGPLAKWFGKPATPPAKPASTPPPPVSKLTPPSEEGETFKVSAPAPVEVPPAAKPATPQSWVPAIKWFAPQKPAPALKTPVAPLPRPIVKVAPQPVGNVSPLPSAKEAIPSNAKVGAAPTPSIPSGKRPTPDQVKKLVEKQCAGKAQNVSAANLEDGKFEIRFQVREEAQASDLITSIVNIPDLGPFELKFRIEVAK